MKTPPPPALVRAFDEATRTLRGAEPRKMFGYPAMFVNGNMFAGLVRDTMILRLGAADIEKFLDLAGATPFIAMGGRQMKQWVVVPSTMLKSRRALKLWLGRALTHGRSLPVKGPRRRGQRGEELAVSSIRSTRMPRSVSTSSIEIRVKRRDRPSRKPRSR